MTEEQDKVHLRKPAFDSETRASLLARLKTFDDHESWRDFFTIYGRLIYSVACGAGLTEQEAQDAVQETVISVAKTMPSFKYDPSVCSFKTWLRHLTQKRIVDQFRKRLPASALPAWRAADATSQTAPLERVPDPQSLDLQTAWDIEWQRNIFDAAVKRVREELSVEQFQIFDLYALKNWRVKQVCDALGVSATQVYLARHRVMRRIKQEVKRLEKGGL